MNGQTTRKILEIGEQYGGDKLEWWELIARTCLKYMSEREIAEMCEHENLLGEYEEEIASEYEYEIDICEDCYLAFHGVLDGELPIPEPLNLIRANMELTDINDSGDGYSFGKSPCDGCGSHLSGNRFIMHVSEPTV